MTIFPRFPLLFSLVIAAGCCGGCMQPVEASSAVSAAASGEVGQAPHRCRTGAAQTTQKGCRVTSAVARN